jgi:hypothetical protein
MDLARRPSVPLYPFARFANTTAAATRAVVSDQTRAVGAGNVCRTSSIVAPSY